MEKKVRFGMIGCGQIMPATAKGILDSQHCKMIGVHDIDEAAAKEKSEQYGVPYSIDLWNFLNNSDMDAVYIAVPHALHVPIAVEAARAGKHVMVEKPMATDVEDAKMLVRECRDAGVKLSLAMGMRYSGTSKATHDLINKGAIGSFTSYLVRSIGFKDSKYWSNGVFGQAKRSCWRAYKGMAGGGILVMNAVHNLDALYYITGAKPVEVMAMGDNYSSRSALEDSISLLIRFDKNHAYGVCQAMSAAHGASHTDNSTFIYGTHGTIRFVDKGAELFTTVDGLGYETGKFVPINCPVSKPGRSELVDGFAEAILNDTEPFITGEEGVMITDLMLCAYRSVHTGQAQCLSTSY
ncbi:MAG: Gfo/Idh/MocA family oxidoreductase [Clostridiales bacterium]|nr:Gfo/Idh/MocA family oxidoreductase [Clostridiales bacterium]